VYKFWAACDTCKRKWSGGSSHLTNKLHLHTPPLPIQHLSSLHHSQRPCPWIQWRRYREQA
jgi:hypothetical protein